MSTCFRFRFTRGQEIHGSSSGEPELLEDRISNLKDCSGIKRHAPSNDGEQRVIVVRCNESQDVDAFKLRFSGLQDFYEEIPCRLAR